MSKYRKYKNIDEFPFLVGEVITYRFKKDSSIKTGLLIETIHKEKTNEIESLIIGSRMYTNTELFDWFEYLDPIDMTTWHPFGIEEEE